VSQWPASLRNISGCMTIRSVYQRPLKNKGVCSYLSCDLDGGGAS